MSKDVTMFAKITPPFVLLSAALLLWSGAVSLSSHLALPPVELSHGRAAGSARMGGGERAELPAALQALRKIVEERPNDVNARLEFARALRSEAYAKEDGELLMETVRAFGEILDIEKENPEALLSLASLCLEAGIIDKAITLFPRYLSQRPDDWRAKIDYSLALIHAERSNEALKLLDQVAVEQPDLFQVRFAQALALKLSGDIPAARTAAAEAAKRAPNEEAKARLQQFVEGLDSPTVNMGRSGPTNRAVPAELLSPAKVVAEFFQQHQIIGPKFRGVKWPEVNRAQIALENFPVEQMPQFAREKFLAGVKAHMKLLPSKVTIVLVDAQSERELLSLEVGGESDAK